jgi:hypothetical protein
MSRPPNKRLLSDVLAEETDAGFRDALLGQALRLAKRRRHFRKAQQAAYVCAVVAVVAVVSFRFVAPKPISPRGLERPYVLVTTRPLPAGAIVSTSRDSSTALITSSPTVELVTTSHAPGMLTELDDDELLALAPSPAVLVRRGPHLAELVFADPKAEQALLRN